MSASVPPPPQQPPAGPPTSGYPITFTFDSPGKVARWRPLVHWLLAIPHFLVLIVLGVVAEVLVLVSWILGVITGKIPEGILGVIAMYLRYSTRVSTYYLFLREEYPPFSFETTFTDPGDDPRVRQDVVLQAEGRSRLTIFFRYFLALPHFFVLTVLFIGLYVVMFLGFFSVLILGRWPAGLESYVVGVLRWNTRLGGYFFLLTDKYPPFSFS